MLCKKLVFVLELDDLVRPDKIAVHPGVWEVHVSHDSPNLLHGREIGTETAMAAEDLLVDYDDNRETVEAVEST